MLFIKFQCLLKWSELFVRSALRSKVCPRLQNGGWVVGQHVPKVYTFLEKQNTKQICCSCTVPHDLCIGLELLMLTLQVSKNKTE